MSGRPRGRGRGQDLPFRPQDRGGRGAGRGDRGGGGRGGYADRGGGGEYRGRGRGGFERGGDRGGRGRGGMGRGGPPVPPAIFSNFNLQPVVDNSVMQLETKLAAQTLKRIQASPKSLSPTNPARPGYGTRGREIVLWTNYFKLASKPKLGLDRYNVEVKAVDGGREPPKAKVQRLFELLIIEQFASHSHAIASDYKSTLITSESLGITKETYVLHYRSELEDEPDEKAKAYRFNVVHTGHLMASDLIDYLTSSQISTAFQQKEEVIAALNIIIGNHPKRSKQISSIRSNRHYAINPPESEKFDLSAGLQAIRGYLVSVRAATARILVNVQVKNMAFYPSVRLDILMSDFLKANNKSLTRLSKFLRHLAVDVTHINRKNSAGQRIQRIRNIVSLATKDDGNRMSNPPKVEAYGAGPPKVSFFLDAAGRHISVSDYFQKTYKITMNPNMPVINIGTKDRPSYVPAEVCHVLPGQPAKSLLTPTQTQQMIKFAVRRPHLNAESIVTHGNEILGFKPNNDSLMLAVPARVLMSPDVNYQDTNARQHSHKTRFGSWNLQGVKVARGTILDNWAAIYVYRQGDYQIFKSRSEFEELVERFTAKLREVGVQASPCKTTKAVGLTNGRIEEGIETAIRELNNVRYLLVVVTSQNNIDIYKAVKTVCDIRMGVLNTCVQDDRFARANEQYFANVALKFNVKLGGTNHSLDANKMGVLKDNKTMVVGIDVTHPSPGSASDAPSVAAIVAATDGTLAQMPADIRIQTAREEMVDKLEDMVASRLKLWREKNRALPESLLVYRDGVSEGQYNLVLQNELPAIRKACQNLYPATDTKKGLPKITIIIVGKRHHTRFYPTNQGQMDRSGNPQNGTVVDRGITQAWLWDFFLQAHTAIQGTARPAHYYVIYDEIFRAKYSQSSGTGLTAQDALEELTHNICYLFPRATKAVSICPAAYHADLACERGRDWLRRWYDPPQTPSGSVTSSAPSAPGDELVRIHPNVKNAMFYV